MVHHDEAVALAEFILVFDHVRADQFEEEGGLEIAGRFVLP
jgi:hypothetical protein